MSDKNRKFSEWTNSVAIVTAAEQTQRTSPVFNPIDKEFNDVALSPKRTDRAHYNRIMTQLFTPSGRCRLGRSWSESGGWRERMHRGERESARWTEGW